MARASLRKTEAGAVSKAVTGLAVIVVGVLVALAADRWNQDRQERGLEEDYLIALVADLSSDSLLLDSEIAATRVGETLAKRGLEAVASGKALSDAIAAEGTLLGLLGPSAQPLASSWMFQELQGTGNMRLLSDRELRRALYEYYSLVDFQRQRMGYIQARGRDVFSEMMWARATGGSTMTESLGDGPVEAELVDALERLRLYHPLRRTFLEQWAGSVNVVLALARGAADR